VRKDGSKFWGSIVMTAIHNENNEVVGFSKVTRDLTERKNAEDRLVNYTVQLDKKNRQLQISNKELGAFSYVASHDLQEPLRKIQTFGKRILDIDEKKLSDSGRESFRRMINAAERMQKLIDDLLVFSRAHNLDRELESIDLNTVLGEIKNSFIDSLEEIEGTMILEELPVVDAIPFQMQQLFQNLINNAIKYRRNDVPLRIHVSSQIVSGQKLKELGALPESQYHQITIEDNGIGFEEKYAEKIFEIFQRLHGRDQYPGTGIGLAICKRIVENNNGFINAKGTPHKGATFNVYFPVAGSKNVMKGLSLKHSHIELPGNR
jgi:light-regulated signal transduction histidine kinase (bacteriophytochrome)